MPEFVKALLVVCDDRSEINGLSLVTMFNPKEVSFDKSVPWQEHPNLESNDVRLEFTAGKAMDFGCELIFDTFETRQSVKPIIDALHALTLVDPQLKRPPLCKFVWGKLGDFKGVVESVGVKYTLFMPDGSPVRATVTLKMKQADKALTKDEADKDKKAQNSKTGVTIQAGPDGRVDAFAARHGLTHRQAMERNNCNSAAEFSQVGKVRAA